MPQPQLNQTGLLKARSDGRACSSVRLERLCVGGGREVAAHLLAGGGRCARRAGRAAAPTPPRRFRWNARLAEVLRTATSVASSTSRRTSASFHLKTPRRPRGDLRRARVHSTLSAPPGGRGLARNAARQRQPLACGSLGPPNGSGDGRACRQGGQGCWIVLPVFAIDVFPSSHIALALRKCGQSAASGTLVK